MLFPHRILAGVRAGTVTLAFRRWRRPPPTEGATLRTAIGVVELTSIREVNESMLTDADAQHAGFASRDALVSSLAESGTLYRMRVRVIGDDPRSTLREQTLASAAERRTLVDRLLALDRRSNVRWVQAVLESLAANPGVPARDLATTIGLDRDDLKRRVRRLKELGLTESLTVGYRLSPRGRAALNALRDVQR